MSRRPQRVWSFAIILLLMAVPMFAHAEKRPAVPKARAFFPRFDHLPLDPPIAVTGTFGEHRRGHFHGGLDLSTAVQVGKSVYAPLSGEIERVRASGVGYGRALYLKAKDGRLLVFGHLDAFAEPIASYVAAAQESTGLYEQDLWPEPGTFRVRAGQRIAWTGQSGAGGPHLHIEIRRGDMALNPFEAGLMVADRTPPKLERLTLEPLDDASSVEGGAIPYTLRLRSVRDTLTVLGRVRAAVVSHDAIGTGRPSAVPWWVGIEFNGRAVECRFDSVSWATDMSEADYVYDLGRVVGEKGVVLWAPPAFKSVVLGARGPSAAAWGTIEVRRGDPPRILRISAGDVGGNVTVRELVLEPPKSKTTAPAPAGNALERPRAVALPAWRIASLPEGRLRVRVSAAPPCRFERVSIGGASEALIGTGRWRGAVLRPGRQGEGRLELDGVSSSPPGPCRAEGPPIRLIELREGARGRFAGLEWSVPAGALFEPAVIVAETLSQVSAPAELSLVGKAYAFHPPEFPLRAPIQFRLDQVSDPASAELGLYQETGDGWEFVRARNDSAPRRLEAESRRLGRIAIFRDATAPRIRTHRARPGPPQSPYRRWALEAQLQEEGSGMDAQASYFEVDGQRVPSEWDPEANILRWRPHSGPRPGTHRYQVVAQDRSGNIARAAGTFVLD